MREAIEKLVKTLVDAPESVEVNEKNDRSTTIFEVRVAENDMGKLIGREGRTARSLRSLVHAASIKQGRRFSLEIVE